MTKDRPMPKERRRLCVFLRVLTAFFAILVPVAIVTVAVVTTLLETDWWSDLFLVYLALYTLLGFTSYFSLLTIFGELTRYARRKSGEILRGTHFMTMLRRILQITAAVGLLTAVFIPLILLDLMDGRFSIIHFAIGIMELALYVVWGIYAVVRRVIQHRRAEQQRLADEKQAWVGYLS